jgi:hypothetical protein
MLFLWFISLHVPNAIADPYAGRGNRIVSAFDALLFCGVALILSQSKKHLTRFLKRFGQEMHTKEVAFRIISRVLLLFPY